MGGSGGRGGSSSAITNNVTHTHTTKNLTYYTGLQFSSGLATTQGYGASSAVYFHYNGSTLADPRGSTGALGSGSSTDEGSYYTSQVGRGHNYYGFSLSEESLEAAEGNVHDVISDKENIDKEPGTSFNPAPAIDLEFYYTDPKGIESAITWNNPDVAFRNTGYNFPTGYSISGYYVTHHVNDVNYTTEGTTKYYTVAQVDANGDGMCQLPEEDAVENVNYWSVIIEVKGPGGTLLSPITVVATQVPVVAVIRPDDSGAAFLNLDSALNYIKNDPIVGTESEPVEYRVVYMQDYHHNIILGLYNNDSEALENFDQGNTHLIFESMLMSETNTAHTNRFKLSAYSFALPRDNPEIDTDDNITVTFRDFRIDADLVISNGCDLTIESENLLNIGTLRSVNEEEVATVTTTEGKWVDIHINSGIDTIALDNGQYAPELLIGPKVGDEDAYVPQVDYNYDSITGASRFIIKENAKVVINTVLDLPYFVAPIDENKNGDLQILENGHIKLPGDSVTNKVGNIKITNTKATMEFSAAFDTSEEAPLKVMGVADIDENGLEIEIEDAYLQKLEWIGKDIIQFTSLDKVVTNDYWSTRLYFDVDENTCSLELWDYRSMKVEVAFPDTSKITYPSYEEAMDWIENIYKGANGTYTISLIDNYDRLGLGGDGLDSNDNIALKHFYKDGATLIFTSTINTKTGDYYTFVEAPDDYEEQIAYGGYNEHFAMPSNPLRGTMNITLQNMPFAFVENVYMGNIAFTLYETVTSDSTITYHGTYDLTEEYGLKQSTLVIPAHQVIKGSGEDEESGIGLVGFDDIKNNDSSKLYVNQIKKAVNYEPTFHSYINSEIYLVGGGVYELGNMTNYQTGIDVHFNHPEAIVHSYGTGFYYYGAPTYGYNLHFPTWQESINRDLFVFFDKAGNEMPSYAVIAPYMLYGDVYNHSIIENRENVICTKSYVAVLAPEQTGDDITEPEQIEDRVYYYHSIANAVAFIQEDTREGEYEIIFTNDYTFKSAINNTTVKVIDNTALYNFNRENVEFNFTSKHREYASLENIRYVPSGIGEVDLIGVNDIEIEVIDEYAGYNKVRLSPESYYEAIILPGYGSTPSYFNEIVFELATLSKAVSIRGAGGGITMDTDVRVTNGVMDVNVYAHSVAANYFAEGQDPYLNILGGEFRNIYGANDISNSTGVALATPAASIPTVNIEGGVIDTIYGGAHYNNFLSPTEINIRGGTINKQIFVGNSGYGNGTLNIYGNHELPKVSDFDYFVLHDESVVKMKDIIHHNQVVNASYLYGEIHFGTNSQLQLYEPPSDVYFTGYNTAGKLVTDGPGASLIVYKMTDIYGMRMQMYNSIPDTSNGALTVMPGQGYEYLPTQYDEDGQPLPTDPADAKRYTIGDNIFYFNYQPANAQDITHYNNGFFPLGMAGNTSGFVYLSSMPITMAKNDGEHVYYTSIAAACDEMNRDDNSEEIDYTIIIRQEDYTVTAADSTAMGLYAKDAKSVTITGAYTITEDDTPLPGEVVGTAVKRKVKISSTLILHTNMYFDNIVVEVTGGHQTIYAMGHELYIGTNKAPYLPKDIVPGHVEMVGNYFPHVYGGSNGYDNLESTHIELGTGKYSTIYGGGLYGRILGDTYVQIGNHPDGTSANLPKPMVIGDVYGGGYSCIVDGETQVNIYDAEFTKAEVLLMGGGYGTVGSANMEIWNLTAPNSIISAAGTNAAAVLGDFNITVPEGSGNPTAKEAHVYGSYNGANIGGDFNVRIHGGEGLTSIRECRAYNYARYITGEINIHIGTGGPGGGIGGVDALKAELNNIYQFDNLYIGYNEEDPDGDVAGVGYASGAAHVVISQSLIGVSEHGTLRNGTIHMLEGSTLTLPTTGVVKAANLSVDSSLPHLYIGKKDVNSMTNPLLLSGDNLSDNETAINKLIIGLQSEDHNSLEEGHLAEVGDNLLQFTVTNNARDTDYVSGVDKFEVVVSPTEAGIIEFGGSSLPEVTQTLVEHKDAEGNVTVPALGINASINPSLDSTLNTVMKTLHFEILNEDEDGDYSGYEIDTGYINNTGVKDKTWSEGGAMPYGVTPITIVKDEVEDKWYAKVSLNIESYGIAKKPYYVHVRDERGAVKVVSLDVHSPIYTQEPLVEQVDGGDYHITLTMNDPIYQEEPGSDGIVHPYNAAGIFQGAYTIGTTLLCPGEDEILENRSMSVSENVKDVLEMHSSTTSITGTATVPKELLEGLDLNDTVIYIYVKDTLGNTRRIAIPMSEYTIDVSIPTRVGMVAVASTSNALLAPECFVINHGNNSVKAEIIDADISTENELEFVTGAENLGKNKIWLVITADRRPEDYMLVFDNVSIQGLDNTMYEHALNIGTMSSASVGKNAAYYTFAANYIGTNEDPTRDLDVTGAWDLFTMKYRFTVVSE